MVMKSYALSSTNAGTKGSRTSGAVRRTSGAVRRTSCSIRLGWGGIGVEQFLVQDPDGYLLRFTSRLTESGLPRAER
jgi:hypothetical protein